MHEYRHIFYAICPNDGDRILYGLRIFSRATIMVESIREACDAHASGFQENIAADLHRRLGGYVILRGTHQGVTIISRVGCP